jgi:hypothetical protein
MKYVVEMGSGAMIYIPSFIKIVGFEVFTAVVMKSIISWDMTPCSSTSLLAGLC